MSNARSFRLTEAIYVQPEDFADVVTRSACFFSRSFRLTEAIYVQPEDFADVVTCSACFF
jgi:hypothetical protein